MDESFPKNENPFIGENHTKRNNLIYQVNAKSLPMIPLEDFESLSKVFEDDNKVIGKEKRNINDEEMSSYIENKETTTETTLLISTYFPDDIEGSATIEPRFRKIIISPECGSHC
uniref:Uncharacterized protein n=1 Tax=Parastrongyloides trichosuri TaxID=131310 RepID=A0A0N4ZY17_PARTI